MKTFNKVIFSVLMAFSLGLTLTASAGRSLVPVDLCLVPSDSVDFARAVGLVAKEMRYERTYPRIHIKSRDGRIDAIADAGALFQGAAVRTELGDIALSAQGLQQFSNWLTTANASKPLRLYVDLTGMPKIKKMQEWGFSDVIFDRSGSQYDTKVKAIPAAAPVAGLSF